MPTALYAVKDFAALNSPFGSSAVMLSARCDMETDGGGWMVIQRRVAYGTVNFTREWSDYVSRFGDLDGELWYGLDNIHYLTTRDDVELRVDMVMEDDGSELTWTYQTCSQNTYIHSSEHATIFIWEQSSSRRRTIAGKVIEHAPIMCACLLLCTSIEEGYIGMVNQQKGVQQDTAYSAVIICIPVPIYHF